MGGTRMHKKIVALTLLAALFVGSPGLVFAFGLGGIEINSALNQPMNAEIDLVGFNAAMIDELQVELASQEMFERVGVPRPYILTQLKFMPTISNGKPVIKVTSTDAIREPFLAFLVDVRWAKGKLLREYTALLDPPVFGDKVQATIQAPKVASKRAPTTKKLIASSSAVAKTAAPPSARPNQKAASHTAIKSALFEKTKSRSVRRGDTLWSIAEPYARENGVSVNQMMLAIQKANPQSFTKNNINNLKSGVVLRIPTDDASKYSARETLAEVRRQSQVWKQGTQADSNPTNVDASDMVDGEVTEMLQPKQELSKLTDSSLSILGDDGVADGKTGDDVNATLKALRQQVNLFKENLQSKSQENAELEGRIESLELMIKKQENIISLQNELLAQLQNTLTVDGFESEQEVIGATEQALASAEELAAEINVKYEQGIRAATVEPLLNFSGPIPEEFLVAEQQAEATQAENLIAEVEMKPKAVAEITPLEATLEIPFVEKITTVLKDQSKTLLYAGGALIVLLLGWLGIKRRNANTLESDLEANELPAFEEEPSIDEMLDVTVIAAADSVDDALDDLEAVDEGGESEVSVFAGEDIIAESDDVLAEADVYISYSLYQQAEELLNKRLAKEPGNAKYQVKLAEIYYADKKSDEFMQHVEAIESGMDKQSPEWTKISLMGASLVPAHTLFTGVAGSAASDAIETNDSPLDFTFGDDGELNDAESDGLEKSSTAVLELEAGLDFDINETSDDGMLAFEIDDTSSAQTSVAETRDGEASLDLDEALNLEDDLDPGSTGAGIKTNHGLDDILDGYESEAAIFDSTLFDVNNPEANKLGKSDLDDSNNNLTTSETSTLEKDMFSDDVIEQFDIDHIGSTMDDLGDDLDLENPSVIEEVGTKLDLAKAFVAMGEEDAAKETLTEVMEQGDQAQIQLAKDLLDKLN